MEGKLIKMVEGYTLSLTGSIDDLYGISDKQLAEDHQLHKLSIKNCDAIANGYDLIKLIEENSKYSEEDWGDGFLFAMNLMSDKKFNEEDIKRAFIQGVYTKAEIHRKKEEYIQSLQQTEWDVEILMGTHCRQIDCVDKGELVKSKIVKDGEVPQLDKDGCLILKRK